MENEIDLSMDFNPNRSSIGRFPARAGSRFQTTIKKLAGSGNEKSLPVKVRIPRTSILPLSLLVLSYMSVG